MRQSGTTATGGSGGDPARIQPGEAYDAEDLRLPPDERLDRMLGDADLLLQLQLSGYADNEWEPVAAEFARYGFNVMKGWLWKGVIFDEVARTTGTNLRRPDDRFDDDAVNTLATDTVIAGLRGFLKVLRGKKWDPAKGASLKTYFIGQCKFQFRNIYKSWYRQDHRRRRLRFVDDARSFEAVVGPAEGPDNEVIRHHDARGALEELSTDKARRAFALHSLGYSNAEIADELGVADAKSVENLLGYQRKVLKSKTDKRERKIG